MASAPDRGDVVLLNFDPTLGSEQRGRRPAVVISPILYNRASGLAIVCPITSASKGYPFEVSITNDQGLDGAILVDQVRCIDWKARSLRKMGSLKPNQLDEVLGKLKTLVAD